MEFETSAGPYVVVRIGNTLGVVKGGCRLGESQVCLVGSVPTKEMTWAEKLKTVDNAIQGLLMMAMLLFLIGWRSHRANVSSPTGWRRFITGFFGIQGDSFKKLEKNGHG